jgi:hypothetical protein
LPASSDAAPEINKRVGFWSSSDLQFAKTVIIFIFIQI